MDVNKSLGNKIRGSIIEFVIRGLKLFSVLLNFLFPKEKSFKVMTQKDIANIVSKNEGE